MIFCFSHSMLFYMIFGNSATAVIHLQAPSQKSQNDGGSNCRGDNYVKTYSSILSTLLKTLIIVSSLSFGNSFSIVYITFVFWASTSGWLKSLTCTTKSCNEDRSGMISYNVSKCKDFNINFHYWTKQIKGPSYPFIAHQSTTETVNLKRRCPWCKASFDLGSWHKQTW